MDRMAVDALVRETVGLLLGRSIDPEAHVARGEDPDWDSLKHIEIVFAVEGVFDIRFREEDLGGLVDIDTIVDTVVASRGT